MNMFARTTRRADPPPPSTKWQYLNFDEKRAGRAVAEGVERVIVVGGDRPQVHELIAEHVMAQQHILFAPSYGLRWEPLAPALPRPPRPRPSERQDLVAGEDDPDTALVQWFVEQQDVAEQATRASGLATPDDSEAIDEVILARPNGPRSRRSWRGGGTMHRR